MTMSICNKSNRWMVLIQVTAKQGIGGLVGVRQLILNPKKGVEA